jgi:putative transposase
MANKTKSKRRAADVVAEPLPTIWNTPDDLWALVVPVLDELDPPHRGHRPRTDPRKALDGIIYRVRSGVQWNRLPKEFGDDATVHRTMQRWVTLGVLDRVWGVLVQACAELGGVDWSWQSVDGAMGKARFGGTASAPTRRTAARTALSGAC